MPQVAINFKELFICNIRLINKETLLIKQPCKMNYPNPNPNPNPNPDPDPDPNPNPNPNPTPKPSTLNPQP